MTASRWLAASRMSVGVFDDLGVRQPPLLMLAEQLGKADHGVERRPQLMAHVGDEFGLHLARQLGLDAGRMLGDARSMTQNRIAQQRRVFIHQRTGFRASDRSKQHQAQPSAALEHPLQFMGECLTQG